MFVKVQIRPIGLKLMKKFFQSDENMANSAKSSLKNHDQYKYFPKDR
jgi:hypothetical protein